MHCGLGSDKARLGLGHPSPAAVEPRSERAASRGRLRCLVECVANNTLQIPAPTCSLDSVQCHCQRSTSPSRRLRCWRSRRRGPHGACRESTRLKSGGRHCSGYACCCGCPGRPLLRSEWFLLPLLLRGAVPTNTAVLPVGHAALALPLWESRSLPPPRRRHQCSTKLASQSLHCRVAPLGLSSVEGSSSTTPSTSHRRQRRSRSSHPRGSARRRPPLLLCCLREGLFSQRQRAQGEADKWLEPLSLSHLTWSHHSTHMLLCAYAPIWLKT